MVNKKIPYNRDYFFNSINIDLPIRIKLTGASVETSPFAVCSQRNQCRLIPTWSDNFARGPRGTIQKVGDESQGEKSPNDLYICDFLN